MLARHNIRELAVAKQNYHSCFFGHGVNEALKRSSSPRCPLCLCPGPAIMSLADEQGQLEFIAAEKESLKREREALALERLSLDRKRQDLANTQNGFVQDFTKV